MILRQMKFDTNALTLVDTHCDTVYVSNDIPQRYIRI